MAKYHSCKSASESFDRCGLKTRETYLTSIPSAGFPLHSKQIIQKQLILPRGPWLSLGTLVDSCVLHYRAIVLGVRGFAWCYR